LLTLLRMKKLVWFQTERLRELGIGQTDDEYEARSLALTLQWDARSLNTPMLALSLRGSDVRTMNTAALKIRIYCHAGRGVFRLMTTPLYVADKSDKRH
jgi:hypothetical protein